MQREAPQTLVRLIHAMPNEVLSRRSSGKWSVGAIHAHMAEDELVSSWRYHQTIQHSGPTLPEFDQNEWARLGDYDAWPPREGVPADRFRVSPGSLNLA